MVSKSSPIQRVHTNFCFSVLRYATPRISPQQLIYPALTTKNAPIGNAVAALEHSANSRPVHSGPV